MARVTVEDCILQIPNRFELVLMSAQRARDISAGSPLTVDRDKDKNPVVALREIAERTIDTAVLENALIQSQQRYAAQDEPEEDQPEFDALEGELEAGGVGRAFGRVAAEEAGEGEGEGPEVSLDELAEQEVAADDQAADEGTGEET